MMKTIALSLCALVAAATGAYAQDAAPAATPVCSPAQITLNTSDENGTFDGMSHSGTRLVLRNISPAACSLAPFAQITLTNRANDALSVTIDRTTPFSGPIVNGQPLPLGHGPVVLPIIIPPGATSTAALRWVSGDVFDHSVCVDARHLAVDVGGSTVQTAIAAHICGADADHIAITTTRLVLASIGTP